MSPASKNVKSNLVNLVRRLPAPRDEQAIQLLRTARDLAKGNAPKETSSNGKVAYKTAQDATDAAAERLVRDVSPRRGRQPYPPLEPEGIDPLERAAVRNGWQLVDAYERLTTKGAQKVFGHELKAWFDYALETVPNLEHWGRPGELKGYESPTNRLRFRRTMDFVREGERIFDVGFGRGYLAGVLMRDRNISAYHGIDILPEHIGTCQAMLPANGFTDRETSFVVGDVYDLKREDVEAKNADFVICCEVLEHVPDAALALKRLADALPDGADLLFSVPLHGRIEGVWGHVSVFDVARLKQMIADAGLYVHHVEPLANVWTVVVASKSPQPSERVAQATTRPATNVALPLTSNQDFIDVKGEQFSVAQDKTADATVDLTVTAGKTYEARVSVTSTDPTKQGKGTVSFPVDGVASMRVFFDVIDFEELVGAHVRVFKGNKQVAVWRWKRSPKNKSKKRRNALRPGESTPTFKSGGADAGVYKADRVDINFFVKPGQTVSTKLRAAFLPSDSAQGTP